MYQLIEYTVLANVTTANTEKIYFVENWWGNIPHGIQFVTQVGIFAFNCAGRFTAIQFPDYGAS